MNHTNYSEKNEVEEYINQFNDKIQLILKKIRNIIVENAPHAVEHFSYGMPAYKVKNKPLIYFAAFKNHIGIYATPSAHTQFKEALSDYKQGKGSVQFPINQPIPYELIEKIIQFKMKENDLNGK